MAKRFGIKTICLLLSTLCLFSACSSSSNSESSSSSSSSQPEKELVFVEDGKTNYSILLPENATDAEVFAAEELNLFCKESTGLTLPVAYDNVELKTPYIAIGETKPFAALGITLDEIEYNYDGFIVKNQGDNVIINGASERGKLYGTYDFAEDVLGVRFLAADYTYIPKAQDILYASLDVKEIPAFRLRHFYGGDFATDNLYMARSRMYSGEFKTEIPGYDPILYNNEIGNFGHNAIDYVRVSEWKESHPEFFASYTNSAYAGINFEDICYTNGLTESGEIDESMDVSCLKITIERMKMYAENNPDVKIFFIGIEDHMGGWCMCEKCNAWAQKFVNRTSAVMMFANRVAIEIQKWSDEKYGKGVRPIDVGFFAYFWCESAPVIYQDDGSFTLFNIKDENGNEKPFEVADNLWVRIAPLKANYGYGFQDERQTAKYRLLFDQWSAITDKIMLWDYVTYFHDYFKYFPNLSYFVDNIEYFKKVGVQYCLQQSSWGEQNDWQSRLLNYIAMKAYWESNIDVTAIIKEYLSLYYGAGANDVWNYIEMMENYYAYLASQKGFSIDVTANTHMYTNFEFMPLGLLQTGLTVLENAEKAIQADETISDELKHLQLKHIAAVQTTPLSMMLVDYDDYFPDRSQHQELCKKFIDRVYLAGFVQGRENRNIQTYFELNGIFLEEKQA